MSATVEAISLDLRILLSHNGSNWIAEAVDYRFIAQGPTQDVAITKRNSKTDSRRMPPSSARNWPMYEVFELAENAGRRRRLRVPSTSQTRGGLSDAT